jgi:hypothetical protein
MRYPLPVVIESESVSRRNMTTSGIERQRVRSTMRVVCGDAVYYLMA